MKDKKTVTRKKIVDAGFAILLNGGKLDIQGVAKAAGVAVPTIYHYFDGLSALEDEVHFEAFKGRLPEDVDEMCEALRQDDPWPNIRELLTSFMGPERDTARQLRFIALGAYPSRPDVAAKIRELQQSMIEKAAGALVRWHGREAYDVAVATLSIQAGSPIAIANPSERERQAFVDLSLSVLVPSASFIDLVRKRV